MSVIGKVLGFERKSRMAEEPQRPVALEESAAWAWSGRYSRPVSAETALTQATTFACVSLIAESIGMLPLVLYRRLAGGKERATDHPLFALLHDRPNPELTSQELYENLAGHLARLEPALINLALAETDLQRAHEVASPVTHWHLRSR